MNNFHIRDEGESFLGDWSETSHWMNTSIMTGKKDPEVPLQRCCKLISRVYGLSGSCWKPWHTPQRPPVQTNRFFVTTSFLSFFGLLRTRSVRQTNTASPAWGTAPLTRNLATCPAFQPGLLIGARTARQSRSVRHWGWITGVSISHSVIQTCPSVCNF